MHLFRRKESSPVSGNDISYARSESGGTDLFVRGNERAVQLIPYVDEELRGRYLRSGWKLQLVRFNFSPMTHASHRFDFFYSHRSRRDAALFPMDQQEYQKWLEQFIRRDKLSTQDTLLGSRRILDHSEIPGFREHGLVPVQETEVGLNIAEYKRPDPRNSARLTLQRYIQAGVGHVSFRMTGAESSLVDAQ